MTEFQEIMARLTAIVDRMEKTCEKLNENPRDLRERPEGVTVCK